MQKETLSVASKSPPKPHPPTRTTSLNPSIDTEISDYLDEAFNEEDDHIELISQTSGSGGSGKSPGILRKGEPSKNNCTTKRNVVFDEHVRGGRYEPMVDHESLPPSTVAAAKAKLFGGEESESFRYNRLQLQSYSNVEPREDLLEAIESALQPTSYMEEGKQIKEGFSVDVGPPSVPPPVRSPEGVIHNESTAYSLDTSPDDLKCLIESSPPRSNPTIDDTPTTSTFITDHETMYRSIVWSKGKRFSNIKPSFNHLPELKIITLYRCTVNANHAIHDSIYNSIGPILVIIDKSVFPQFS